MDTAYMDFSHVFDTVSHEILVDKLWMCWVDEQEVMWIENPLNGWALRVVITGGKAGSQ